MTGTERDGPERSAWLVIAGIHHLNGSVPTTSLDPLVIVALPAPLENAFPSNTIVLDWASIDCVDLKVVDQRTGVIATGGTSGRGLFSEMEPGEEIRRLLSKLPGDMKMDQPLVPTFYLSAQRSENDELHVYSQVRFLAENACFIRTSVAPVASADPHELAWLADAVSSHASNFLFLNNHQRYYQKRFPGKELEYKYTLDPPVDIWTPTVELLERLRAGDLDGYILEYRDEFQAWDYKNHLFQVTAPESEQGYVSFIPTTDGKNLVKRKWFSNDSFERRESHTYGVEPSSDFASYVRDELRVTAIQLPPFRRVRYDVNFESVRTGHVYGIFFDHVSLFDAPEVTLNQCELEYLRTRAVVDGSDREVLEEIDQIATWLEAFLEEQGLSAERGYYSKLTFLLDAVAAQPELAREPT